MGCRWYWLLGQLRTFKEREEKVTGAVMDSHQFGDLGWLGMKVVYGRDQFRRRDEVWEDG